MNIHFSKKKIIIFLVSIVLLAFGVTYSYLAIIQPLETKHATLQAELKTEQTIVRKVSQKGTNSSQKDGAQSMEMLQRKLPVKPLFEQYVLDLEKAEGLSGVTIQTMALQDAKVPTANGNVSKQAPQPKVQNANTQEIPKGTVPLTVIVEVKYTVYEQLQAFLKAVERLERITYVQGVDFKGRQEIVNANTKQEPYKATVTITTYYMPSLQELEKQAPDMELPPLCKDRTNPVEPQNCK